MHPALARSVLMKSYVAIRKRWLWTLITLCSALVIFVALLASAVPLRSAVLKQRIVDTLSAQLNSNVTLDDLSLRAYPRLHVEGAGLKIRDRRRPDVPPLIAVKSFSVDADLMGLWRKRVSHVELHGLEISIPPDTDDDHDDDDNPAKPRVPHRLHEAASAVATSGSAADKPKADPQSLQDGVVIDTLVSKNARLIIIPGKPDKEPKTWDIHALTMHRVGVGQAMPFTATITNAVPPGEIYANGGFGPWDSGNPGRTPLSGTFTFDNANLSVFKGIAGTLSSRGSFGGSLDYIDVNGQTETPNFLVEVGGHPFGLNTTYHAIVDGTNGDTRLEQIDARFLQTMLTAKGAVLDGPPGTHGRTVSLDVAITKGRIEDIMRMVVKQNRPPMVGTMQLTTKFLLPPGKSDVIDRLRLNGQFTLSGATFTNRDVQTKIVQLSRRGRGKIETPASPESIASDFKGYFALGDARLTLKKLMFAVPGAQVRLDGSYALRPEALAFKGNLLLDAKVSQTVGGWRSLLLRIADPFFNREGGGSSIPIKIEGTKDDPKFGLDMSRVFKRGN
jgi:hypothetical protein